MKGEGPKVRHSRKKVPCAHIADFYETQWLAGPSIGTNLLRIGYRQWAEGRAELSVNGIPANNLYGSK